MHQCIARKNSENEVLKQKIINYENEILELKKEMLIKDKIICETKSNLLDEKIKSLQQVQGEKNAYIPKKKGMYHL